MRLHVCLLLSVGFLGSLLARSSEGAATYPLWDGQEPIASYARRAGLPATKEIGLRNGVRLEMVLIPAGRYVKGTPKPERPDLAPLIDQLYIGAYVFLAATGCLIVMACYVVVWARRFRHRTQYSLARFMVMATTAGIALLGGLHWCVTSGRISGAENEYESSVRRWSDADMSEKSAEEVLIPRPFYLGKYEVTQEQYEAVLESNPSGFKGPARPADRISFADAQTFCVAILAEDRIRLRLPSDSEWEYACRAGSRSSYHTGEDAVALAKAGWFKDNSKKATHEVGQKEPNRLGLYDMHGNVSEWCGDVYDPDGTAGLLFDSGPCYWVRGGSWFDEAVRCRSAFRHALHKHTTGRDLGFRVAMDVTGEVKAPLISGEQESDTQRLTANRP